jgi:competence protein ComEC
MSKEPKPPWWQHEAAIAWALILFFPVGIYLMWKHAPWRNRFKWLWSLLAPLVAIVVLAGVFGEEQPTDAALARAGSPTATVVVGTETSTAASLVAGTPTADSSADDEVGEPPAPGGSPSAGEVQVATTTSAGLLHVYFLDVTLGDAVYIRTPGGQDIIIDGGDDPHELSLYLDQLGEPEIDLVIASHPHADHIRGLTRVVRERTVLEIWTNGESASTGVARDLDAAVAVSPGTKRVSRAGDTISLGGVNLTVLWPATLGGNTNDNSVVVRLDCGTSSFLFTGDAEANAERAMIAAGANLDIDVLKVGHHGSRTSTSAAFISATRPLIAVYQARLGNRYGHPHQEVLDRLAAASVTVYGTGVAGGTVVVSTACDGEYQVTLPGQELPSAPGAGPSTPSAPAQPTASPVPDATSAACSVTASVSNAAPTRNSTVTVSGTLTCDGAGVAGAPMVATWNYKTTTSSCSGTSNAAGLASCSRSIGSATSDFFVRLDVCFTAGGRQYCGQTGFTPE